MIRVVIADDHPVVRQGIRQILSASLDVVVTAEAASGSELRHQLSSVDCDLVLLDLSMPGSDGLELLKALRRDWPGIPVLVLTIYSEEQFAVRTLKAGASGYLTKDSAPSELVGAVHKIVAGGRYITPTQAERLVDELGGTERGRSQGRLSDREFQVLRLISAGKTARQIGEELSLSPKTVATYRGRICEKLQLRTAAELVAFAVRQRLFE